MKHFLILSLVVLSACADATTANNSNNNSANTKRSSPANDNTDAPYLSDIKRNEGITWQEASEVLNEAAALKKDKVKSFTITRLASDHILATSLFENGKRKSYLLRPYSTDGISFSWKADPVSAKNRFLLDQTPKAAETPEPERDYYDDYEPVPDPRY